jgi:hypothetical protein
VVNFTVISSTNAPTISVNTGLTWSSFTKPFTAIAASDGTSRAVPRFR